MKMMQGAFFLPCSNRSRTRLAPTPTNISTKSEPEMEKNGTFASPATARASRVLPVPGGPTSNTPLGILPPSFWNFCVSRRNSMISFSSSLASSTPATSLKVTFFCCMETRRARLFPNDKALFPPVCICRIMKNHRAASKISGAQVPSNWRGQLPAGKIADIHADALIPQHLDHVGIVRRGGGMKRGIIVPVLASYLLGSDGDLFHVALIHIRQELREVDFFVLLSGTPGLHDLPQQESRKHDHQPENCRFNCRIHRKLLRK